MSKPNPGPIAVAEMGIRQQHGERAVHEFEVKVVSIYLSFQKEIQRYGSANVVRLYSEIQSIATQQGLAPELVEFLFAHAFCEIGEEEVNRIDESIKRHDKKGKVVSDIKFGKDTIAKIRKKYGRTAESQPIIRQYITKILAIYEYIVNEIQSRGSLGVAKVYSELETIASQKGLSRTEVEQILAQVFSEVRGYELDEIDEELEKKRKRAEALAELEDIFNNL